MRRLPGLCIALQLLLAASVSGQSRDKDQWPSFRGQQAAGVSDGQALPERWDGARGTNVKWKTRIPGLSHSSPIVWGGRVFVTTAVSSRGADNFRHGLYGDGTASE